MKLIEYLIQHNLSARTFAKKADIAPSTIYRCLQGKAFSMVSAKKIEKATEGTVSVEDILQNCKRVIHLFGVKDD